MCVSKVLYTCYTPTENYATEIQNNNNNKQMPNLASKWVHYYILCTTHKHQTQSLNRGLDDITFYSDGKIIIIISTKYLNVTVTFVGKGKNNKQSFSAAFPKTESNQNQ